MFMDIKNQNRKNARFVVLSYPQYAGGKFLINCLSVSRSVIPLDIKAYSYLIDNPDDYEFRTKRIMSTLPAYNKMKSWLKVEDHTWRFYGIEPMHEQNDNNVIVEQIYNKLVSKSQSVTNEMISRIIENDMLFFSETPSYELQNLNLYIKIFPNLKFIKFTNYQKFWQLARTLKNSAPDLDNLSLYFGNYCEQKYNLLKGNDWPSWSTFEKTMFNVDAIDIDNNIKAEMKIFYKSYPVFHEQQATHFDVDLCFFNKEQFCTALKELYAWLGLDDFDWNRISPYYDRYMQLHVDKAKTI